jgi:two-component system LytT family sensor kinase
VDNWHLSPNRVFLLKPGDFRELVGIFKKSFALSMYPFVFSKKIAPRLARHLAFWGMYFVCATLTYLPPIGAWAQADRHLFTVALFDIVAYLPVYLLSVYSALYFVLPRYLGRRNIGFLAFYAPLSLAVSILSGYFITKLIFKTHGYGGNGLDVLSMALQRCMADLITITGAAVTIKILKDYFLQQRENEMLAVENIRNKLQLLKMQMHPRILFASLRRIHMELDAGTRHAPEMNLNAPEMILKLSDLLSYLLYESETDRVPLSKEVKMIENYIALKKLEYKGSIDIRFQTGGGTDPAVTPGLLLPLLEIGVERPEDRPQKTRVAIELRTAGSTVFFSLSNNMPGKAIVKDPSVRATLDAVRKRLQSSPHQKFKLEVYPAIDSLAIVFQVATAKNDVPDHALKTAKG